MLRDKLSNYFGLKMGSMTYSQYLSYLNTNGKIEPRSILEILMMICEDIDEKDGPQVKSTYIPHFNAPTNELPPEAETPFELPESLKPRMISKDEIARLDEQLEGYGKLQEKIPPELPMGVGTIFSCPECGRTSPSEFGLKAHVRSHNKKASTT